MLHRLYIIMENGTAVFEKIWFQIKNTETQLLSGFLTALTSFAIESLGSGGLQSLQLANNERLAFYTHEHNFLTVIIADDRDNQALLNKIMVEIANSFYFKYKEYFNKANLLSKTKDFENVVENIIKNKVSNRNIKKLIYGTILSFIILASTFVLTLFGILNWSDYFQLAETLDLYSLGEHFAVLSMYITTLFFIPSIITGYISGNRKWGVISASSLMIISFILILLLPYLRPFYLTVRHFDITPWIISFSPLIFGITVIMGYIGAWIKERTKLYQLDPDRIIINQRKRDKK
ncbi:MAG: hypothetical protein EAX96_12920 [Candidatus Lokiarchaeota archaeon]|nr:hypothetical protein [Candidatus Lokiarchaeota archaeon]